MTDNKKILFAGGDVRQLRAASRIAKHGVDVSLLGFDAELAGLENARYIDRLEKGDFDFSAVVLPLPYSTESGYINAPLAKEKIVVSTLFNQIPQETQIIAGKADAGLRRLVEEYNLDLIDYFDREELQILNAIPTAEGAIQIAMEETLYTLHSSQCLIIGSGRISKILAKMLKGLGAKITVAARKNRDRVMATAFDCQGLSIEALYDQIGKFDIIFNTVPAMILDYELLSKTRRGALIIDLASKPGGTDFNAARKMGIKVIWALSLPGKVAPYTAGDIIGKTILNILEEGEV